MIVPVIFMIKIDIIIVINIIIIIKTRGEKVVLLRFNLLISDDRLFFRPLACFYQ